MERLGQNRIKVETLPKLDRASMHKNNKLLPYQRRETYRKWLQGEKVSDLAKKYDISRECLYEVFRKARLDIFSNCSSMNNRYRNIYYGLRKLDKMEQQVVKKIAARERRKNRYERQEPRELVHFDTKKLPLLPGEAIIQPKEYLHLAIDDYSRWVYADIFPEKTSYFFSYSS